MSNVDTSRRRWVVSGLLLNGALPLACYLLARPRVPGELTALAMAAAVPVVVTVTGLVVRRHADPIGVVAVVAFAVALVVLALSGGNTLVLKLQEAVVTGPVGVACLVSVAAGRPLHLLLFRLLARRGGTGGPARAVPAGDADRRRVATAVTSVLGTTLVVHALVLLVLALSVPTGTYLAVARPAGLGVVAAGAAVLMWCRRRAAHLAIQPPTMP